MKAVYEEHEKRVIEEKGELDFKIEKLNEFIASNPFFAKLPEAEQARMRTQSVAMKVYSDILGERIDAFALPPQATASINISGAIKGSRIVELDSEAGTTGDWDKKGTV